MKNPRHKFTDICFPGFRDHDSFPQTVLRQHRYLFFIRYHTVQPLFFLLRRFTLFLFPSDQNNLLELLVLFLAEPVYILCHKSAAPLFKELFLLCYIPRNYHHGNGTLRKIWQRLFQKGQLIPLAVFLRPIGRVHEQKGKGRMAYDDII